jgi:hypothetical protein
VADTRIMARGLRFPEGPVAIADGSVILGEIAGSAVTRVAPDGEQIRVGGRRAEWARPRARWRAVAL